MLGHACVTRKPGIRQRENPESKERSIIENFEMHASSSSHFIYKYNICIRDGACVKLIKASQASAGYIWPFSSKHRLGFWNIFTPTPWLCFLWHAW